MYRVRIEPKRATETAAVTMVVVLFPSHTIKSGAKADLGRLFKRTKNGSKTLAAEGLAQRRRAQTRPAAVQTAKLISVSMRVTPVWRKMVLSAVIEIRHLRIRLGLLKINRSMRPKLAESSHKDRIRIKEGCARYGSYSGGAAGRPGIPAGLTRGE